GDIDALQVVLARGANRDLALERGTTRGWRRNGPLAAEVGTGERAVRVIEELFRAPLKNQLAAMLARAWTKVDHVIGGANGLLIVLDDHHRVPEVPEVRERLQQLAVVALVQADRRLV